MDRSLLTTLIVVGLVASCGGNGGDTSSGGGTTAASGGTPSKVTLSAFSDFQCSSNWTTRDGAWGLRAYSGSGSCQAAFPGASGAYRIEVVVQTEFDGNSPYRVSINGQTVASGSYPYSTGRLVCDCPNWQTKCPDRKVSLSAGTHQIKSGDVIEFWGDDVYPCGQAHGSYAKWHRMEFSPG